MKAVAIGAAEAVAVGAGGGDGAGAVTERRAVRLGAAVIGVSLTGVAAGTQLTMPTPTDSKMASHLPFFICIANHSFAPVA